MVSCGSAAVPQQYSSIRRTLICRHLVINCVYIFAFSVNAKSLSTVTYLYQWFAEFDIIVVLHL